VTSERGPSPGPPVTDPAGRGAEALIRFTLSEQDIDGLGHLNQSRYHHVLGLARMRVLTESVPETELGGAFVVARAELDYLREVRLADGFVDARAEIVRVGNKSVEIVNEVVRPDGIVAARGVATMVAWDSVARRSRPVSDVERAAFMFGGDADVTASS
jgi:acyl-CoA thioester hydrolase